jgi:hypothetical protein
MMLMLKIVTKPFPRVHVFADPELVCDVLGIDSDHVIHPEPPKRPLSRYGAGRVNKYRAGKWTSFHQQKKY